MIFSRNALTLLVAVGMIAFSAQAVQADLKQSNQYSVYLQDGGESFRINDDNLKSAGAVPLYEVFNEFFKLTPNGEYYTSSNDLIDARGFVVTNDWVALPDAKIYSAYQNYINPLTWSIEFESGPSPDPIKFPPASNGEPTGWILQDVELGNTGRFSMSLDAVFGYTDPYDAVWSVFSWASDGLIHMIAIDVTDLMQLNDPTITSAWLFAWEASHVNYSASDFGYYNLVQVLVNVDTFNDPVVPEPATALILLTGLAAYPAARRFRKN